jgi:hypothetical protein
LFAALAGSSAANTAAPARGSKDKGSECHMSVPTLEPKAGFDWGKVTWGRPDSPPTVLCSYCSAVIPDDDIPLILSSTQGYAARFCKQCRKTWWGFEEFDEPEFDA